MPDIYGNIPTSNTGNQIPSFVQTPQVDDNLAPIDTGGGGGQQPVDKSQLAWAGMFQSADNNKPLWADSQRFTSPAIRTPYKETERYLDPNIGYSAIDPDLEVKYGEAHPIQGIFNRLIKTGAGVGASILQAGNDVASALTGNGGVSNEFDTDVQDWLKRLDQVQLPTYQTLYQKEHPIFSYFNPLHFESWLQNVGNAAQQLAPIAGTIASSLLIDSALGIATDGIADTILLPRQLERVMEGMGSLAKGLTASPQEFGTFAKIINQNANLAEGVKTALAATKNFKYGANATRYMLSNGVSSYLMSQMIGNQTYNEVKNDVLAQYKDEYGNSQLTDEMRDKVEQNARDAGNAVLLPNFAFMSISSAFGLSSILRPAQAAISATEKALSKDVTVGLNKLNPNEFVVTPKTYPKGISGLFQRGFNKNGWLVDNSRQALTMGGFYVATDATKNFYENKFNIPGTTDTMTLADSYMHSLGKLFTTTEGQESLALGFLGGAMEHVGKWASNKARGINTSSAEFAKTVSDSLNKYTLTGLFDVTRQESIASTTIAHDIQEAAATGDVFKYKNLQHEALFNFVSSAEKLHQFDARINQLDSLRTLNKENFETLFNLEFTDENKRNVNSFVDALINKARSIREDVRKVDGAFPPNPFSPKDDKLNHAAYNFYKDELAFNIGRQKDYLERSKKIREDVHSKIPSGIFEDITALSSPEGLDRTIDKFEKKVKDLKTSEELSGDNAELKAPFTAQREFLEGKIKELKSSSKDNDPDSFIQTVHSLYNYYGNLNSPTGDFHIDEPTALGIYNNSVDIHRLFDAGKIVADYYRKLASKSGFETFKGDVLSTLRNYNNNITVDDKGIFRNSPIVETPPEVTTSDIYESTPTKEDAIAKVDAEDKEFIAKVLDPNFDPTDKESLGAKILSGEAPIDKDLKDEAKAAIEEDFSRIEPEQKSDIVNEQMQALGVIPSVSTAAEAAMDELYKDQDTKISDDAVSTNILDKIWRGLSPIKLFNKMFTPKAAKDAPFDENLRNIIFNSPNGNVSFKGLRAEISDNIDFKGRKPTRIKGSNLYRMEYDKHVYVYDGQNAVGILQPPSSISFKRGDTYLPLSQLADAAEYAEATKNNPTTFDAFKRSVIKYESAYNELVKDHKEGDPVVHIDNNRLLSLFDPKVAYGSRDKSTTEETSTLIKDLKYKGKGSAILSFPTDAEGVRAKKPNILNLDKLSDDEVLDVISFVDNNIGTFESTDRRYFYLNKLPDGKFHPVSIIAARVMNETEAGLNSAYDIIRQAIDNPTSIEQANESLKNQLYIADRNIASGSQRKQAGNQIQLGITADGDLSVSVYNTKLRLPKHITVISKEDVQATKNFDELSDLIEAKFNQSKKENYNLGERLRPVISKTSFKKNALDDDAITAEEAEATLKASVTPNVFKDYALEFMPKDTVIPAEVISTPEVVSQPEVSTLAEAVPDAEYNTFINKGEVAPERVTELATKVINQSPLSPREVEIFTDKTTDINTEIKNQAAKDVSVQDKLVNDNIDAIVSQLEQKGIAKKNC